MDRRQTALLSQIASKPHRRGINVGNVLTGGPSNHELDDLRREVEQLKAIVQHGIPILTRGLRDEGPAEFSAMQKRASTLRR